MNTLDFFVNRVGQCKNNDKAKVNMIISFAVDVQ